jgi:hypothetical protein
VGIYSGKVVDGQIQIQGALLPEGITVTIVVPDVDDEPFDLSPDMIAELEESIAQIERGEYVTWEELRAKLKQQTPEALPR